MSKAEELANKIAPPPGAEGWYYAPSIYELMEAAAHLRALEANRQMLVETLGALVEADDAKQYDHLLKGIGTATPMGRRWANAAAALEQAKELT